MFDRLAQERNRRDSLWTALRASGGPDGLQPSLLRSLNVYAGARGIYTDAETTEGLAPGGGAATVSLLHTGKVYPDELSPDSLVYHYPNTKRPGKDLQEIEATKATGQLGLPVFVITTSTRPSLRDVRRGWVTGWDDAANVFLVIFSDDHVPLRLGREEADDSPFRLTSDTSATTATVIARPGQARFKFDVFRRYGAVCAVCDLTIEGLLDAAHIRDKRFNGSDDPRNGLVLCALHHRALDRGLFGIRSDLSLHALPQGPALIQLGVTRSDLLHLPRAPHTKALDWRWKQWQRVAQHEDPHAVEPLPED
jgi:putative restriction endonuclease